MAVNLTEDQNIVYIDGQFYIREYIMPPETISFHETSKRWVSFYDFFPEVFCKIGIEVASFLRGELFIHDRDELNYNTFAAENPLGLPTLFQYPSTITTVSNLSPSEIKIYQSLYLESSDIWEVDALETEKGQFTTIPEMSFTKGKNFSFEEGHGTKENTHYVSIPMDENSPGGRINGDRIRSHSIIAKFSYFKNNLVKLFSVGFNVVKSFRKD